MTCTCEMWSLKIGTWHSYNSSSIGLKSLLNDEKDKETGIPTIGFILVYLKDMAYAK